MGLWNVFLGLLLSCHFQGEAGEGIGGWAKLVKYEGG